MTVRIGTIRMGYTIQPCGLNGMSLNGGNHYANADTIEGARECAQRMFAGDRVASVTIQGNEFEFRGHAWEKLSYGAYHFERIERDKDKPLPLLPSDMVKTCYPTTILDRYEVVHERRSNGTCRCGKYPE